MTTAELQAFLARRQAKAPQPTGQADEGAERDLHQKIMDECDRRRWLNFHGAMNKATHRTCGEPDHVILADRGRVFLIECKSKSGKLSMAQLAVFAQAITLGHSMHVIRSFREFLQLVDAP
jgi:hypothetical protein